MHKQVQIFPGVYLTDFRKDQSLVGLGEPNKELTNDVGLLLDQVQCLEDKIQQLEYSIKQIQNEQNWEKDADFLQAVEQDWKFIVKFSYQMKEKVLRLYQLQYHPQSQKVEELLKITRIQDRQALAIQQVKKNLISLNNRRNQLYNTIETPPINNRSNEPSEQKKLVKVSDSNSDEEYISQVKQKQHKKGQTKQQKPDQKQQDKGVYI